jgi:hypothetical protein
MAELTTQDRYEHLQKWAKKMLGENFDKFDLKAEVDSSLSIDYNGA